MIVVVLVLAVVQHVSAAVPMMREQPQLIDDVEGVLMAVPDYEDPIMLEHQLSAMGVMPIFTLLDAAKKEADRKEDDLSEKLKIAEAEKVLDDAIYRLQLSKTKLEKGNSNIYVDIEKSIQNLKKLERISRPDARQVLSSLQALMSMARPLMASNAKEDSTTSDPEMIVEKPAGYSGQTTGMRIIPSDKTENYDSQLLGVRVIPNGKTSSNEKIASKDTLSKARVLKEETVSEEETTDEESPKHADSSEVPKESKEPAEKKYESEAVSKDTKNPMNEELLSYKAKLSWKSEGML